MCGLHCGSEPVARLSCWIQEELLEIPGNVSRLDWAPEEPLRVAQVSVRDRAGVLEECEEWLLLLAVDLCLGRHGDIGREAGARPHVLEQVEKFVIPARLLQTKLVTGHGQDSELLSVGPR